ncbi:probable acetyl xylan esterase [Coraliomargarita sp. CAG:312]|nr:probable acetyl xylan esterase [Coraliomargarita sp. CAG:312]
MKKYNSLKILAAVMFAALAALPLSAQKFKANYDESKIPDYQLPDILQKADGKGQISSSLEWLNFSRPRILSILENEFYGHKLPRPEKMKFEVVEESDVFSGIAVRKQIKITVSDKAGSHSFTMLMYEPKAASKTNPAPAFIALNFKGNHATSDDKNIAITKAWMRGAKGNKASEEDRGVAKKRWPFEEIVKRGYAIATIYYGEIYPDKEKFDGTPESVYRIFDAKAVEMPAIAAWSWGLSRGIDALESMPEIDSNKIFVVGHSRLGKTALLTGAYDKRVAICASNDSGCMGAAISRRAYGETVDIITTQFPFWFAKSLNKYKNAENTMPIDQHQLVAMMAPRPVYVASATEDKWADPKGELMALVEASKVYKLFGAQDLPGMDNFTPEKPFHGDVGYHLRIGKHDITVYDWMNYCDFADKHFGKPKNQL